MNDDGTAQRSLDWSIWSSLALKGSICCRDWRQGDKKIQHLSSSSKHRKGRFKGTCLPKPLKSRLSITTGVKRRLYSGPTCTREDAAKGREFHSYSFMNILNHISSSSHVKLRKGKGSGPQSDSSAMLYKYRYEIYSIPSYLIQSPLLSISPNVQIWKRLWPNCHLYQPEKQDCDYDCLHSGE